MSVEKLTILRDHHLKEAQRCADALALLKEIDRLTAKAARVTRGAATRAKVPSSHPASVRSRQDRRAAKAHARPIDRVRAAMHKANGEPVRVLDLLVPTMGSDTGPNRRALGVVIGTMKKRKELKERDGAVTAWHLLPIATANGASAG